MLQCTILDALAPFDGFFQSMQCNRKARLRGFFRPKREARQAHAGERRPGILLLRKPVGVGRCEIDHEADDRHRLERQATNTEAADFNEPFEAGRGSHQQAVRYGLDQRAIVSDETREGQASALHRLDEIESKASLAGPRGATDQQRAGANQHRRRVDTRRRLGHRASDTSSGSARRQAHDEARAQHLRLAVSGNDADAVLGADAPAVRFDDLA